MIRYADDFVVLHEQRAIIERAQQAASAWLAGLGLELKPSKTRITHTLHAAEAHGGPPGFDFLGFHVRQYPAGKTHAARYGNGRSPTRALGFNTLITPSKAARRRHLQALRAIVARHRAAPQAALIARLNPVIRGWTRYYATVASAQTFGHLAHGLYLQLRRWAKRRHPQKSGHWIARRYWRPDTGHWHFATPEGARLAAHHQTPIRRHVKVKGDRSPFDGDWVYWATRLGTHPETPTRVARLLQRQQGRCAWCGLYFAADDLPELDHVVPKHQGGTDAYANWQLLHRHCHDAKTALDGSGVAGGAHDRGHRREEPDEAKAARPVLEAGGRG